MTTVPKNVNVPSTLRENLYLAESLREKVFAIKKILF